MIGNFKLAIARSDSDQEVVFAEDLPIGHSSNDHEDQGIVDQGDSDQSGRIRRGFAKLAIPQVITKGKAVRKIINT